MQVGAEKKMWLYFDYCTLLFGKRADIGKNAVDSGVCLVRDIPFICIILE